MSAVALVGVLTLAACSSHTSGHSEQPTTEPMHAGQTHDSAPVEPVLAARKGERILTVGVPDGFVPQAPAGATDEYRCFLADPGLTTDAMLTGAEFIPAIAPSCITRSCTRPTPNSSLQQKPLTPLTPSPATSASGSATARPVRRRSVRPGSIRLDHGLGTRW